MKKTNIVFPLLVLALMGCDLMDDSSETQKEERMVNWGLRLQIGGYILDSIFPPADWNTYNNYSVTMSTICTRETNCMTVPHTGQIYGWDETCLKNVEFFSTMGGGGVLPVDSLTGEFDFSSIFIGYQGGVTYKIWPNFKKNSDYVCLKNPAAGIAVTFSLY